ncbi:MAG: O-antigen ligase family protein [Myxococcota bacterium]|nr:O-antigen ligase family protein [Myxococcota bacterium]
MAEAFPSESVLSEGGAQGRGLVGAFESAWFVYFLTGFYVVADDYLPIPSFYLVVGVFLLYFAMARPFQLAEVALKPIFWVWALTMLIPLLLYFSGGSANPFAWSSATLRTTIFAAFAGSAVLLSAPRGAETLRAAARIALATAVLLSFADLVFENPYNRSEETGRTSGLYADANTSAAAIGALLLLAVDVTKQSFKGLLVVGISVLAIISTQSRSGMIFAVFLLAAYLLLPRGPGTLPGFARFGVGLIGLVFIVGLVLITPLLIDIDTAEAWRLQSLLTLDFDDGSAQGRVVRFEFALSQFLDNFWSGKGIGAPRFYGIFSHNAFLETAVEYGVGGLLIYLFLIGNAFFRCFRFGIQKSWTPILITTQILYYSFFSHTIQQLPVYAVFFAGILVGTFFEEHDSKDSLTGPGAPA